MYFNYPIQSREFTNSKEEALENNMRKGENASNKNYLHFKQVFCSSKSKFQFYRFILLFVCITIWISLKVGCVVESRLYPGFLGKGPWPNWEKKCRQNFEIGKNILTEHIKLEAYSTIMNISMRHSLHYYNKV